MEGRKTPTLVPQPPITTGLSSTVNTLSNGVVSLFTGGWPVLVTVCLLTLLALLCLGIGMASISHISWSDSQVRRSRMRSLPRAVNSNPDNIHLNHRHEHGI